jgi:hypothetical protein
MSRADIASLRKLYERMEHQGWAHHVADAATGKLVTTRLSQPLAPLSRAERLSQVLGTPFDRSIFGSPTYRLTVQHPYQQSPLGFLRFRWASDVHGMGQGGTGEDEGYALWWRPDLGENVAGMDAVVFDPPQGLALLTLFLATSTQPGQVGVILVDVLHGSNKLASFRLTVPGVDEWMFNTFDLVFTPLPSAENWIRMTIPSTSGPEGVYFYTFTLSRLIFVPPFPVPVLT